MEPTEIILSFVISYIAGIIQLSGLVIINP